MLANFWAEALAFAPKCLQHSCETVCCNIRNHKQGRKHMSNSAWPEFKTESTHQIHEDVRHYYGRVLTDKNDLKTSACCIAESVPQWQKAYLSKVHPEILAKFYGCGSPLPSDITGLTVLDLGCGTGRDVYLLSQLVGETGQVIGVDMTEEQLSVARKHEDWHRQQFGYARSNVSFRAGYIEDLRTADIQTGSIDLIISNCVVNLSPRKDLVFAEMRRVLKKGGELYFSDVYADRRIPAKLKNDQVLYGECLSGALYLGDFRRLMLQAGFADPRVISSAELELTDPTVTDRVGQIGFFSNTVRAFALDLEDACENFGQVALYNGSSEQGPHQFQLDDHHIFPTGAHVPVCGNTADMLSLTRFRKFFTIYGNKENHLGLFNCAPQAVLNVNSKPSARSETRPGAKSAAKTKSGCC